MSVVVFSKFAAPILTPLTSTLKGQYGNEGACSAKVHTTKQVNMLEYLKRHCPKIVALGESELLLKALHKFKKESQTIKVGQINIEMLNTENSDDA